MLIDIEFDFSLVSELATISLGNFSSSIIVLNNTVGGALCIQWLHTDTQKTTHQLKYSKIINCYSILAFSVHQTKFSPKRHGVLLVITPQVIDHKNLLGKEHWKAVDIINHYYKTM